MRINIETMKKKKSIFVGLACLAVALIGFMFTGDPVSGQEGNGESWFIRCGETKPEDVKDKRGACEMFQTLMVTETKQRLTEFAIGYPADQKDARGVIILPLGILLPAGVQMQIDDQQAYKFDVRYCTAAGCFAHITMNKDVLDSMRKGKAATIRFQSSTNGQPMAIEMPLGGFGKALKEIS